jgi:hypothetical protein
MGINQPVFSQRTEAGKPDACAYRQSARGRIDGLPVGHHEQKTTPGHGSARFEQPSQPRSVTTLPLLGPAGEPVHELPYSASLGDSLMDRSLIVPWEEVFAGCCEFTAAMSASSAAGNHVTVLGEGSHAPTPGFGAARWRRGITLLPVRVPMP